MDKFPNTMKVQLNKIKTKGKNATQIIEDAGIGRTSFYDIMAGKQIPKIDTAYKIADALHSNIEELFPKLKG